MKRSTLIFFGILFAIAVVSCTDMNKTEHLASINDLSLQLDSIETILNENHVDSIAEKVLQTNGVELRIKRHYVSDTIDREFGRKMDRYKLMRRAMPKLGSMENKVVQSVNEERTALANLKTDIDNASGERDKYDEYIAFEKEKVNQIKVLLNDFVTKKVEVMQTYDEMHEEMYNYSMSLVK